MELIKVIEEYKRATNGCYPGNEYWGNKFENAYNADTKFLKTKVLEKTETFDKAIKYVQDSYCDSHIKIPYILLGDVAEVIKIITGKEIDWNDLAKNLANE